MTAKTNFIATISLDLLNFTHTNPKLDDLQRWQQTALMPIIDTVLAAANLPKPLDAACHYAMSNGGKRVRPLLVLATFLALSNHTHRPANATTAQMVQRAMAAVELIHGYSLVHDDLPCMDDDALRRGQPTCHIVYGEGVALLAGDALQSLAFEALTADYEQATPDATTAFLLLQTLAPRARRMVSGQMLDIEGEQQTLGQNALEAIHRDKTGALIEAAILMGGICANADTKTLSKLGEYAQAIGLAFQVQDDVLDVIADTATLGKPAGSDEKLEKSTYVKLLGVDGASRYADDLFDKARQSVSDFGTDNLLIQIANWLQKRKF
ncbi:polyprenyl synthetase family protein [Moraxella sp. ZJ142]|uniref:polyprenyl synthetase family protein n=1 Tax=Moraxella marmotae TaxID=3344520 RepID=UPI0035D48A7D